MHSLREVQRRIVPDMRGLLPAIFDGAFKGEL